MKRFGKKELAMISFSDLDFIYEQVDIILKDVADKEEKAFKVLVSSVISLRTKEAVTWVVSEKLFESVQNYKQLQTISLEDLTNLLYPCGFYKRKSEQLKKIADIVLNDFDGKTPETIVGLLSLPGVGRKVANLVITEVFDDDGICVDTHVHRIAKRWLWLETKAPDDTEIELRNILPRKYWKTINQYLVLLGQNICLPRNPKCSECFLNNKCQFNITSPASAGEVI